MVVNLQKQIQTGKELTEREAYREGRIVIIEAPQRMGKTLSMSILALDEYLVNNRNIYTNIAYENPLTHEQRIPYKPLNFFELTMEKIDTFRNVCITIDELNFYLDSRGSMTKINRRFCQWLLQSKKMGINTYGTTHNLNYLDLRFRENFDYLIKPICHYDMNDENPMTRGRPIGITMKWYNGPNQRHFRKNITIDFRLKPKLLGLYNTRHVFNPFAEMEQQMEKEKVEKKNPIKKGSYYLKKALKENAVDRLKDSLDKAGIENKDEDE